MYLKRLKLMIEIDIFTIALLILSLINLLNNNFFNSITLIFLSVVVLTINNNLKGLKLEEKNERGEK